MTTLIRGLPEILVVLFIFFGTSQVLFLLGEGVNGICETLLPGVSSCHAGWGYVEVSPFWCGVTALALLFAAGAMAQDCTFFFPQTKGTQLVKKGYDAKS